MDPFWCGFQPIFGVRFENLWLKFHESPDNRDVSYVHKPIFEWLVTP